jgi:hypothetical protein
MRYIFKHQHPMSTHPPFGRPQEHTTVHSTAQRAAAAKPERPTPDLCNQNTKTRPHLCPGTYIARQLRNPNNNKSRTFLASSQAVPAAAATRSSALTPQPSSCYGSKETTRLYRQRQEPLSTHAPNPTHSKHPLWNVSPQPHAPTSHKRASQQPQTTPCAVSMSSGGSHAVARSPPVR